jgi:TRAP-type C4-dicarboxylate transport system permease small subunit
LTVYSMILIVMIGAFLTAWRREHLSNVLLQTRLSGPSRRGVLISIGMVTIGVCGLIALSSFDSVQRVAAFDQTRMRLGVPTALPFFAVIAGFAGMALAAIQHLSGEDAPAHFGGEP